MLVLALLLFPATTVCGLLVVVNKQHEGRCCCYVQLFPVSYPLPPLPSCRPSPCSRPPQAALLEGVDVRDCLERERCLALLAESHRYTQENFGDFVFLLRRNRWDVDNPLLGFGAWRCDWEPSTGAKDE